MQQALLIRLRPLGPWRYGPGDGNHDRVDTLYRSDQLFSAVTLAMQRLGVLEEWLDVTARAASPAVVFGSLFPFQGDTLFATPPSTLWPPPANLVTSPSPVFLTKTRWSAAHFVPVTAIDSLLNGQTLLADQWFPDPESACLLRRDRPSSSPFRTVARSSAAVDRLTKIGGEAKSLAGIEFEAGSGLWTVARFQDAAAESAWSQRVQGAFRLLADTGFGGGRTKGWGQTQAPEFQKGTWPGLLLPKLGRAQRNGGNGNGDAPGSSLYWLLSLYSPSTTDAVDWAGGDYRLIVRAGRVESTSASGALKKRVRMICEGCVLSADAEPVGAAVDVAPDGFAHPVYRSGLALALQLPLARASVEQEKPVEEPLTPEEPVEPLPPVEEPAEEPIPEPVEPPAPEPVQPEIAPQEPPPVNVAEPLAPEEPVETPSAAELAEEPAPEPVEPPAPEPVQPEIAEPELPPANVAEPLAPEESVEPPSAEEPAEEPIPEPVEPPAPEPVQPEIAEPELPPANVAEEAVPEPAQPDVAGTEPPASVSPQQELPPEKRLENQDYEI
ncbi:MAG TPA: hypothetical protein VK604_26535 [Bryobacteraceae bacterium]|nr:hypothetical protein [Bryobacteraceae bacterium]